MSRSTPPAAAPPISAAFMPPPSDASDFHGSSCESLPSVLEDVSFEAVLKLELELEEEEEEELDALDDEEEPEEDDDDEEGLPLSAVQSSISPVTWQMTYSVRDTETPSSHFPVDQPPTVLP